MATISIKARPVGADAAARRFSLAAARLPEDTLASQRELGRASEVVFGAYAPHRTGRLVRGIASIVAGATVIVRDFAQNPESGYDYVGVTRFGHRVARIYPKHTSASVLGTGKRKAGALRMVIGGRVLYRASVAGYHPASDWAEDALPEVEAEAEVVAARLGGKIEARF